MRIWTEAVLLVRRWFPMDETKTGCVTSNLQQDGITMLLPLFFTFYWFPTGRDKNLSVIFIHQDAATLTRSLHLYGYKNQLKLCPTLSKCRWLVSRNLCGDVTDTYGVDTKTTTWRLIKTTAVTMEKTFLLSCNQSQLVLFLLNSFFCESTFLF